MRVVTGSDAWVKWTCCAFKPRVVLACECFHGGLPTLVVLKFSEREMLRLLSWAESILLFLTGAFV